MKFHRKVKVEAGNGEIREIFNKLFTVKEDIWPPKGMDWQRELYWTINTLKVKQRQLNNLKRIENYKNLKIYPKTNQTMKDTEIKKTTGTGLPTNGIKNQTHPASSTELY